MHSGKVGGQGSLGDVKQLNILVTSIGSHNFVLTATATATTQNLKVIKSPLYSNYHE